MKTLVVGLALVWLASLPLITQTRVTVWQHERQLWAEAAARYPRHLRPRLLLGVLAHHRDQWPEAEAHYRAALALTDLRPFTAGCQIAQMNLGILLLRQRRVEDAAAIVGYPCR